jgi:hypothetical protein
LSSSVLTTGKLVTVATVGLLILKVTLGAVVGILLLLLLLAATLSAEASNRGCGMRSGDRILYTNPIAGRSDSGIESSSDPSLENVKINFINTGIL